MNLNKDYIIILLILLSGLFFLNQIISSNLELEQKKIDNELSVMHSDAILNARSGIQVYATLVSSLKSYTKNSATFPSEFEHQTYLKDLLSEINFKDSILVSYIDTNHIFKYVITPNEIDPANLKGLCVKDFRSKAIIDELDSLMLKENITLFSPVNLREGWVGFPFNFSARDKNKKVVGYFAPIINTKYLLNYFYEGNKAENYIHKFLVNDSIDLTRESYYDGSKKYNPNLDPEYYKNFDVSDDEFIFSEINLFNLKLKVGSAFKNKPKVNKTSAYIAYFWYFLISGLVCLIYYQFFKNKKLNTSLNLANNEINVKNLELEKNLSKIQTLIKEIHHRIKNNMQMVSGILSMQMDEYDEDNVKKALRESQNRIHSMSLVHEKLYGTISLKDVKIKEYIVQLLEYLDDSIRTKSLVLNKNIIVDDKLVFDGDTTANLGLIINELVTNSFKYAFLENKENSVSISITKENEYYKLEYKDSGQGLPENFNIKTENSLGIQLINILTEQLSGTLKYNKTPENSFVINFKPLEYVFFE